MHRRAVLPLLLAAAAGGRAMADAYPTKPVKLIVPYAPGGLPDTVARWIAPRLAERLGQGVLVDNKPGGNGLVAYQALLQSTPGDGHAFLVSDGSMLSITPQINRRATYRLGREIQPVSLVARSPLFIVAHPKTGVVDFADFVRQVRARPGHFSYASSGVGSTHHLTMEALKAALKLDIQHIPFRGSGQSTPALVSGQVDFSVAALPSVSGFVKAGQLRLLASNAKQRSSQAPDVPTVAETVPGFDFAVVVGVLGAHETPQHAAQRMAAEIAQVVKMPEVARLFHDAVVEPVGAGPDEYGRALAREIEVMAQAGRVARLQAE